jgi:hypothetical protein
MCSPHVRLLLFAALGISVVGLASGGCVGVYVEAQAAAIPSLTYAPNSAAMAGTDPRAAAPKGSSTSIGIALGVDFESQRTHRFSMGYVSSSTSVGGGGSTAASISDARFDLKVLGLGEAARVRLAGGFGFGEGEAKNGTQSSRDGKAGVVYAGPVLAYYLGKRHQLNVLLGAQYGFYAAVGGAYRGSGVLTRLTYSLSLVDTRPDTVILVPMTHNRDLTPMIEDGATKVGCRSVGGLNKAVTMAYRFITCPEMERIGFLQIEQAMRIECEHTSETKCRAQIHKILEAAGGTPEPKRAPSPPPPIAAPAPASAPAATPPAAIPAALPPSAPPISAPSPPAQ